ncbi:hypothetical protein VB636_05485, partial [Paracoccus sp. APAP_BH8]|uniref:hypothetical protein n=1 Tax=Paracoccus sp. APAP_BH8 TaxID=3110237 RepID=UPI002FD84D83
SAHFAPASCSARMPMICSSVNLVRFIVRPQVGPDSNRIWRKNPGAGQLVKDFLRYVALPVVAGLLTLWLAHMLGF